LPCELSGGNSGGCVEAASNPVAVEAMFVATSPGGVGMPCAGQPYASEMCCVFEVRDGLVVREHDYIDRSPTSA
jgi:ketosteroid isomerase-like protein